MCAQSRKSAPNPTLFEVHRIIMKICKRWKKKKKSKQGDENSKRNYAKRSVNLYKVAEVYIDTFPNEKPYLFYKEKFNDYLKHCEVGTGKIDETKDCNLNIGTLPLNRLAKVYFKDLNKKWSDIKVVSSAESFLHNSCWELYMVKKIGSNYTLSRYYIQFDGQSCTFFDSNKNQYSAPYKLDLINLNCFSSFLNKDKSGRMMVRHLMLNIRGNGNGKGKPYYCEEEELDVVEDGHTPRVKYVEGILSGNSTENTLLSHIVLLKSIKRTAFERNKNSSSDYPFYSKSFNKLIQEDEDRVIENYFKEVHVNRVRTSNTIVHSKREILKEILDKNNLTYPIRRKVYISAPNGSTLEGLEDKWISFVKRVKDSVIKKFNFSEDDVFAKILADHELMSSDFNMEETAEEKNRFVEPIETHRSAQISIVLLPFGIATSAFIEACWSCIYNKNGADNPVKPTLVILDEAHEKNIPSFFNSNDKGETVTMPVNFQITKFYDSEANSFNLRKVVSRCNAFIDKYEGRL